MLLNVLTQSDGGFTTFPSIGELTTRQKTMQLSYKNGLKPKKSSEEIRERFKSIVNASVWLISSLAIVSFLSEFVFSYGEAAYAGAIPLLIIYIWFCTAVGGLAACFGESSSSWALSVFFFNIYVLILAYFAFGEAVRQAHFQVSDSLD